MKTKLFKYLSIFLSFNIIFMSSLTTLANIDHETKLIGGIGISGNYPYIENKIRRYLSIRPGDPYNLKTIDEQLERIQQFYKRQGWHNTEIISTPEYMEDYDATYIHIKIHRGFLLRYRDVNVIGNYSLPTSLVASKINTWKPYTPRRLREAVHKITNVYRKEGYPLARVRVIDTKSDLKKHRIDVTIRINQGPFVSVQFIGNKHLGGKQLLKKLTIYEEGAIDSFELDESVKKLKRRYLERGFPNAQITFKREEVSENHIHITFNVEEEKPERIRNIFIEGNKKEKSSQVKNSMASKSLSFFHQGIYDEKVLNTDTKRITQFYRSKGFLEEATEQPYIEKVENGTQLNIMIPVTEGPQTIVKSINFMGDVEFSHKQLLKLLKIKIDRPLNATKLEEEKDSLVGFYADNGYPYVEVDLDLVKDNPEEANINFIIKSGPLVRFGDVTITGDFLTSQKAIMKAMVARKGDKFSYAMLANSKINLRRLGAFATADVNPDGLEEKSTVIPINVRVQELRPFKLDFDLGYSTDESFIGAIDFVNRNSFGWAKRTIFRLIGGKKFSKGEVGWIDPRFLGHDLELASNGWLQYDNTNVFSYVQGGVATGLYRRYHRTSFLARVALNRNYFLKGSSTAADAESLRNNTIVSTSLSMSWDTRNSFAYPTKGVFAMGYVNFFNEIGGQNAHFVKGGLNNGLYFTFAKRFTLANELRFDNIQTFEKNTSVPSNELLLLGGDNSLRGFDRNSLGPLNALGQPTGGRLRLINSTELRIGIYGNLKWVIFHDMGFLTNSYNTVTTGQLRHSVGFGLNYITPIGPISAVYGFIVDRKPGEHIGRFHLQFGYAF